jgi:16S rRNA (uracil1498-N3)-methyltransferase
MLPFFYSENLNTEQSQIVLNEETSKHCVQVLRMKNGEHLKLTNGKGCVLEAKIIEANKKNTIVNRVSIVHNTREKPNITIAISLVKNNARFEWFLEKATEIGVAEIVPIISNRTEKQSFKFDRLNSILIAAMLQSQQAFLPILHQPVSFINIIKGTLNLYPTKLIAHCVENNKQSIKDIYTNQSSIILIGPEGDFTTQEIEMALENNFVAVTLGNTRLRTETAGMVAATLLANA